MKVAYCLNSINVYGGIEFVTITKANALAALPGYEVYIIVTDNAKPPIVPLHPAVKLIDLKINYFVNDWKSRWYVLYGIFVKRIIHKRRLARVLRQITPDIVVSVGRSEKNMIPKIRGNWKCIREFHSVRTYRNISATNLFKKILALGGNIADSFTLSRYDKIVTLTQEDKYTNWKPDDNVTVIPNPIRTSFNVHSELKAKRVVSSGRLVYVKNHISLIRAFRLVAIKHPDWSLDIYGEGELRRELEQEIKQLGLEENVKLCGCISNPAKAYSESSIFALSSIFEGLPLVLLEAMACGLPVVSYTCPCGPRDIITDGKDGFLVPVNDEQQLADRICRLIEHEDIRRQMGAAALEKSKNFSIDKIMILWTALFDSLVKKSC